MQYYPKCLYKVWALSIVLLSPKDIYKGYVILEWLSCVFQVIPIVSKDTSIKDIPEQIRCATLLQEREDGSHLQHMWDMMQGNNVNIINPFPNTPFWDRPKFKETADDNWNVAIEGF